MPRSTSGSVSSRSELSAVVALGNGDGSAYGGEMAGSTDAPEPDVMEMYDGDTHSDLTCRVCGALVARAGDYPRVHWDWHEAANGA